MSNANPTLPVAGSNNWDTVMAAAFANVVAAVNSKTTAPDLLAVSTVPTALTQDKIQPFNATAGAITNPSLPALSGLAVGATYWFSKTDTSANAVVAPYASGDLSDSGLTAATLVAAGTVALQVVSNPAGGKFWKGFPFHGIPALDLRYDGIGVAAAAVATQHTADVALFDPAGAAAGLALVFGA